MSEIDFDKTLTPVKFPEITKKIDSDLLPRLETILKTIHSNHVKWDLAQKRGLSLCTSIEAIKSKVFEPDADNSTFYPEEMKLPCDKLVVILSIFEDIVKSTSESVKQLTALSKLNNYPDTKFFRTWKLENFLDFVKFINEMYKKEFETKRKITEHIAHSRTRAELTLSTCCWEYSQFVNDHCNLLFKFFRLELDKIL